MSAVVGIDLSSKQIDFAMLDENQDVAQHRRIYLDGKDAWERTLTIPKLMPSGSWWDDFYLVAIEAPYGRGHASSVAILNRVVGAIVAGLPPRLRVPERCWIVRPDEWKKGLGLRGKPDEDDMARIGSFEHIYDGRIGIYRELSWSNDQDARDALCLAYWARETNAKGISDQLAGAA